MADSIPLRNSSRYCGLYAGSTNVQRLLQIFEESGVLCVESRNPETAQTRFELMLEAYYQIVDLLAPSDFAVRTKASMQAIVDRFPSQTCMNEALGICDKAKKLKSVKTQLSYLQKAQTILERGLARNDVGYSNIKSIYDQVIAHIEKAEIAMRENRRRENG
jgi:hypothetical protein